MRLPAVIRSIILFGIAALISVWFVVRDARNPEILYGDALGYYLYLPSTFIYGDPVKFYEWPKGAVDEQSIVWQINNLKANGLRTPKGYIINQYTYGVALMEAPAFLLTHLCLKLLHLKANGFSMPYVIAIRICNLMYALLGVWLTYKILRRWFTSSVSLLVVLGIFLGSNLFWFTLRQAGMSHVPLFFLYALLMWTTIRLYERPGTARFALLGLVAGLITLIRPTDIVCLLIPILYGVYDKQTLRSRLGFLKSYWLQLSLAAFVAFLLAVPQLLYWKAASGSFLYYSYGAQTFNWTQPRILEGLFGGSNGWLAFSPLMLFAIIGLCCKHGLRQWRWTILLLLPIYIYIVYSWYCYNYINGFGSRPMIHLYPLLAIPFAALMHCIAAKAWFAKGLVATLAVLLIAVNLSFSQLQARGLLNSEESNWVYNLGVLFRNQLRYQDLVVKDIGLRQPNPKSLHYVKTLASEDYNDSTDAHFIRDTAFGRAGFVYRMTDEEHHPLSLKTVWTKDAFGDARWIRCSGRFMYPANVDLYENHLLVIGVERNGYYPLWKGLRVENKVGIADSTCEHAITTPFTLSHEEHLRWGTIWCFVPLPIGKMKDGDIINLDLWNAGRKEIYLDDVKIELWR